MRGFSWLIDDLLRRGPRLGLLAVVALALVPASAAAALNDTVIVSRSSGPGPPDANGGPDGSYWSSVSGDGRFVAFGSHASNLVAGDANGRRDVFVRDHQADTTSVVSRSSGDGPPDGNESSDGPSVSGDGRFVTFTSDASNLVPGDTNASSDVFVRDRQTGTTTVVSRSSGPGPPDGLGTSRYGSISANGRFVAFTSAAPNLVLGDANAIPDVFVRDLQENTTRIVSRSSGPGPPDANNGSIGPSVSGDGRFVAFDSAATNLVPGDANGTVDVFVRDLQENTTRIVSRSSGDGPPDANNVSISPSISGDGRFVAFPSVASNLVPGDANANGTTADVFVRDLQENTTRIVSRSSGDGPPDADGAGSGGPSVSGDGRFVAFDSSAGNLVPGANQNHNVFVRDLQQNTTTVVSRSSGAGPPDADGWSGRPSISADGRFVSFDSDATNLVAGDTNQVGDVFRRELAGAGPAPPGTPAVSIGDVTVTEGDSGTVDAALTVSLSAASAKVVSVDYGTADDSATQPGDYVPVSGTLVFAAGETTKAVTVPVKGDTVDEPDERFAVNLSNPQNATVTDSQGAGTITDDDPPAAISVGDATVTEGDTGTVDATFTVSLSPASAKVVSVDYGTADDSATQPGDYESRTGTLTFAAGETSKAVTVAVKGDTLDEPDERFAVNLSNPQNATVTDSQAAGTITDDDRSPNQGPEPQPPTPTVIAIPGAPPPTQGPAPGGGPPPLISGRCANEQRGTDDPETLNGTPEGDNLVGLGGDDLLVGLQAEDCLLGGPGADRLDGSEGDDHLQGNSGIDILTGSDGDDNMLGGPGNDRLSGGKGADRLFGGAGDDRIAGAQGAARGKGGNTYSGGPGNDNITAANGRREKVNCGPGRRDKVRADRTDRIRRCEIVLRLRK